MKKIIYLSHVKWNWIKQRPQFLAEELSRFYNITYICKENNTSKNFSSSAVVFSQIPRLPLERFSIVRYINRLLTTLFFKKNLAKYDLLWSTGPTEDTIAALNVASKGQVVVYDCMDDLLEFVTDLSINERLRERERILYERADVIFASSLYLSKKLKERYGDKNIIIVNNALSSLPSPKQELKFPINLNNYFCSNLKKVVYIGTVAEWIDVNLIRDIINSTNEVEVYFFGPYKEEMYEKLKMERVYLLGAVDHKYVSLIASKAQVLIMPFIVNELIQSVNPVKLYEYIASGKPCLAPFYGESEPFKEYCYLYHHNEECLSLIRLLETNNLQPLKEYHECIAYASNNTWQKRCDIIVNSIREKFNDIN